MVCSSVTLESERSILRIFPHHPYKFAVIFFSLLVTTASFSAVVSAFAYIVQRLYGVRQLNQHELE
jgi:hypothetical protein